MTRNESLIVDTKYEIICIEKVNNRYCNIDKYRTLSIRMVLSFTTLLGIAVRYRPIRPEIISLSP
jgi:hypothetical protein